MLRARPAATSETEIITIGSRFGGNLEKPLQDIGVSGWCAEGSVIWTLSNLHSLIRLMNPLLSTRDANPSLPPCLEL